MRIWQKGEGMQFRNSDGCYGEAFAEDATSLDLAVIEITGRYPDTGYIYNDEAHEMAYVSQGQGYFRQKGDEWRHLNTGDVVYFAPGERVAWKSDSMTIVVPCSPQFDPAKHHEEVV